MTHLANRPLNSSIDSVNVPAGALEAGMLQNLELIVQQNKQMIKLLCAMNLMLGSISGMQIDPDDAFLLTTVE